ncbi:terpene synthase metal binding domain-containing protein [Microdochium trichocladiopsis]|uniref:Terpene synthase n=1 Tax=Microdochium trichocladiopsis TaxID=1682393 RepID=A0A9P8XTV9_9PEZI|nr:terpene synthase metal binding domain-containing protein [Microdochium trichocladiopsis]KAH7018022.1 terpene synthase metal binding domain-containing protein [Microdochium trichocladiopsis]
MDAPLPCSEYTRVRLPDLFRSFLKDQPRINKHYEEVRHESEEWLNSLGSFSPKMRARISRCDFSYFCAIAAPTAPRDRFRTLCDWGNWVFPFDDIFDNGELRDQPKQAALVLDSLMALMLGHVDDNAEPTGLRAMPIIMAHDSVFRRMAVSGEGVRTRFARAMQKYSTGVLVQVSDQFSHYTPDLAEIVLTRRESAGVSPLYHLVEYAHGLSVPGEVFASPIIKEMEVLGMDMVSISNDMLSYLKEEREQVPHNMVAVCRMRGLSAQQSFDTVSELLVACYTRWDELESLLNQDSSREPPSESVTAYLCLADSATRQQALQYVEGIKNVVKANMYWSFKSQRYFGQNGESVRLSRGIDVLVHPAYLDKNTMSNDRCVQGMQRMASKPWKKIPKQ